MCVCVSVVPTADRCLAFFANFSAWRQANWNLCGNFMAHLPQLPEWIYRGQNSGKWAGQQQQHSNKKTKLKQTTRKWNITVRTRQKKATRCDVSEIIDFSLSVARKLTVSNEVLRTAIWCRAMANRLAIHNARQLALLSTRPERIRALDGFYCAAKPQKVVNWFYALFQLTSSWCSDCCCCCCCCWSA